MSVTAVVWLVMFIVLAVKAFSRSSWGMCIYFMTFFAIPRGWWWGKDMLTTITGRWSLMAALIFLAAVSMNPGLQMPKKDGASRRVFLILLFYAINATFVHFAFAGGSSKSYTGLELLWKFLLLSYLINLCIQNYEDLKLFVIAIITGAAYVAYEIIINDRGGFEKGRLEGIFIPGASESNYLAGLMSMCIPLAAYFLFFGKWKGRLFALIAVPMIFDVVLRCNSRGAFLALPAGGARLYLASTGRMRKFATYGIILACLAIAYQAKDPEIHERFWSIFVPAEERDDSALSRIEFYKAGWEMIKTYPMGSGAEAAFKSRRGSRFIGGRYRAVHNGYIDIAASWGIQGFALYMAAIFFAWRSMHLAIKFNNQRGRTDVAFLGVCIEAALVVELAACVFISGLDGEWFYWLIAGMLAYGRVCGPDAIEATSPMQRQVVPRELVAAGQ